MTSPITESLLRGAIDASEAKEPRTIDQSSREAATRLEAVRRQRAISDATAAAQRGAERRRGAKQRAKQHS